MSSYTALKKLTSKKLSELKSIIPATWIITRGKKVYSVLNGISNKNLELGEGNLLYIKVSDMNNPQNKPIIISSNEKCKLLNNGLEDRLIPNGAIIFPKRGAAIFTNKVGIMGGKGTLDPNLIALNPKNDILNNKYLFYYIDYFNLSNICENAGLPQLNKKDLDPLRILLPPTLEQQIIVSILSIVDDLINKTQKIINNLKFIKKGLMQRLFTAGIGHTEFKETRLGKIPKEWEIKSFKEIGTFQYGYTTSGISKDTGIKFLRITDINKDGFFNWNDIPFAEIDLDEISKFILRKGDILIARIGATTGKTCYIDNLKGDMIFASYLIRFKISKTVIPKLVFYYSQTQFYDKFIYIFKEGKLKKGINAQELKKFKIPVPNIEEQKKIVEILSTIDLKIKNERIYINKLKVIKKGLMQDLLTGKKRVKIN